MARPVSPQRPRRTSPRRVCGPRAARPSCLRRFCWLQRAGASPTSYFSYLVRLSAINVTVVYSLNLLMGYAGQAFIATAAAFAIGAYASALGMIKLGLPFFVSLAGGRNFGGSFGLASSLPAIRLSGAYLAMVSIAFNVVVEQVLIHWTEADRRPDRVVGNSAGQFWRLRIRRPCHSCIDHLDGRFDDLCLRRLEKIAMGLGLIAMRESELAAKSLGIDTIRLKAVAFWVSSADHRNGGGLYAHRCNM